MKKMSFLLSLIVLSLAFSFCQETNKPTVHTDDTVARNKAIYLKANAAFNENRIEDGIKLFSLNFLSHKENGLSGREGVKKSWEDIRTTWPDLNLTIDQLVAEGDWVMSKCKAMATHTTTVMGVKPTNKKIAAMYWDLKHFDKDGLIIESWNMLDNAALMQQIGLLPTNK